MRKRKVAVESDAQQRSELYCCSEEKLVEVCPWFGISWGVEAGATSKVVMASAKRTGLGEMGSEKTAIRERYAAESPSYIALPTRASCSMSMVRGILVAREVKEGALMVDPLRGQNWLRAPSEKAARKHDVQQKVRVVLLSEENVGVKPVLEHPWFEVKDVSVRRCTLGAREAEYLRAVNNGESAKKMRRAIKDYSSIALPRKG
jgi:hypothetical protein